MEEGDWKVGYQSSCLNWPQVTILRRKFLSAGSGRDFLGDQNFCDAAVDALSSHETVAGPDAIKHLYDHTSHDSHLRWYVLNIWATRYSFAHIADLFATDHTYPKNFIIDLFKFFADHDRVMDRFGWLPRPYSARAANTVAASGAAITGDEEDEE